MNFFQERYYQKKLRARVAKQRSSHQVPLLKNCKNICFLYAYQQEEKALKDIESFKNFHKDIHVLMYVEGKPYLGPAFTKLNVSPFYEHFFNFFGRLSAEAKFNLLSQKYDLLINTIPTLKLPAAMIHNLVDADFKIGRDEKYDYLSDINFFTDEESEMDDFLKTTANYLNLLNGSPLL